MTDQIELPPRPQTPPVLLSTSPKNDEVIRIDPAPAQELFLNIQIRDEDKTEVLKARWRLVTGNNPPRPPTSVKELDYTCPEPPIEPTGEVERTLPQIAIPFSRFVRGNCYRIDVAVSSSFKSCERNPELFDVTTNEDNEADVGTARYWVYALGGGTPDPNLSQMLLQSCPQDVYQPPPGAATTAMEK